MCVPRETPASDVIDGKLYVMGGSHEYDMIKQWGEVYDPKTQTWETFSIFSPAERYFTTQKRVVPGRLVMDGKVYDNNGLKLINYQKHICLVEIDKNVFCQITVLCGSLYWRDANKDLVWRGLEQLSPNSNFPKHLVSVAKSCGERRVTVWWKEVKFCREGRRNNKKCQTEIWCAEIS
ncbi:unnamed protein product [Arabis nemorensis]|uniref:FKB95-like N-terminal Kelch domain-containing protein n=1 Tax=Arabis nemorensis TaxID=586526 RepID=A0A565CK83_9BRAS|nr:unnamed protein product [Arabis nemorensis]